MVRVDDVFVIVGRGASYDDVSGWQKRLTIMMVVSDSSGGGGNNCGDNGNVWQLVVAMLVVMTIC